MYGGSRFDVTASKTRELVEIKLIKLIIWIDKTCRIGGLDEFYTHETEILGAVCDSSERKLEVQVKQKTINAERFSNNKKSVDDLYD